jgi:predicted methyltransferase
VCRLWPACIERLSEGCNIDGQDKETRLKKLNARSNGRAITSGFMACTVVLLAACATSTSSPQGSVSDAQIAAIVASPDRSAADRANDLRRKPAEMLSFIGLRPGMTALDVSAGGGYTTELLARGIGPTGAVYGQAPPRDPGRAPPAPAAAEGASNPMAAASAVAPNPMPAAAPPRAPRPPGAAVADRAAKLRDSGVAAPIAVVVQPFENPAPAALADGKLDLVTLMFNYHDLGYLGTDRAQMNRAIFQALKSGGLYVIADHAGRPGTGISESGTLHRIEESFLRSEVEAAGFRLAAEGTFLRNPNDPRDKNTPDPAQPKDEFVLKFVKP